VIIVRDEELAQQALTAGTLVCPHAGCEGMVYRDGHARVRRGPDPCGWRAATVPAVGGVSALRAGQRGAAGLVCAGP
jgi:hypothetical protein